MYNWGTKDVDLYIRGEPIESPNVTTPTPLAVDTCYCNIYTSFDVNNRVSIEEWVKIDGNEWSKLDYDWLQLTSRDVYHDDVRFQPALRFQQVGNLSQVYKPDEDMNVTFVSKELTEDNLISFRVKSGTSALNFRYTCTLYPPHYN